MHILTQDIPRIPQNTDFETVVLLVCVVMILIIKTIFRGFFQSTFLLNSEGTSESKNAIGFFSGIVFLLLLSLLSLPFIKLPEIRQYFDTKPQKFIVVFVLLGIFFALKSLLTYLFHVLLNSYDTFVKVFSIKTTNLAWFIIVAFLLSLYYYYVPQPKHYFPYILLGTYLLTKLSDWILYFTKLAEENNLRWYEKILYLCTLELLPLSVLVKFLYL